MCLVFFYGVPSFFNYTKGALYSHNRRLTEINLSMSVDIVLDYIVVAPLLKVPKVEMKIYE